MQTRPILIVATVIIATSVFGSPVRAEPPAPNLAGTYRCEADPSPCGTGKTFTVTETGSQIEFKNESGNVWHAKFTSNISLSGIPTWNSNGVISSDNRTIEWSNGTKWRKQ